MELYCCTTTPNLMPEFLVNSLGFSKEKAISASSKLTFLKPGNNKPQIVVNFFKQIGLNNTQIKTLVSSSPGVLFADVTKALEPKIKVLEEFGLSGLDLAKVVARSRCFIRTGVDTRIRPSLDYRRELLGSDDSVAIALKRCPALLSYRLDRSILSNVLFLQNLGFLDSDIVKLVIRNPRIFLQDPKWLENKVQKVEKEFSIRKDSWMFFYGVHMISSLSKSSLGMKIGIFKSFGWSDTDIITMVQRLPFCFDFI
ncbi:hypothetical protein T459_30295 [Capsicum annuum]|uniref:Uncharacterized protein n=1 Tax=Capsicum annuum TaxID=4072 RepID=A0A2G2Y808_CAPAN|nr:hypothetical protein T459_30295 [Capsicum annuum]